MQNYTTREAPVNRTEGPHFYLDLRLIARGRMSHTIGRSGLDGPAGAFVGLWACFAEENELLMRTEDPGLAQRVRRGGGGLCPGAGSAAAGSMITHKPQDLLEPYFPHQ